MKPDHTDIDRLIRESHRRFEAAIKAATQRRDEALATASRSQEALALACDRMEQSRAQVRRCRG